MEIRNIRHKGLRKLFENDISKYLPSIYIVKISDIVAFLADIDTIDEVFDLQKYKPHLLTGDRSDTYSLRVTANWRITFKYDPDNDELYDLDYEDYH